MAADDARDPFLSHGVTTAADYAGTALFGAQGAMLAVAAGLDVFGVLVVGFVTALGGGIIRDALIGATPVAALADWRYPLIALAGAGAVIALRLLGFAPSAAPLVTLDAAGLALFAVSGARKAQRHRLSAVVCMLMGGVTGVGGGVIRDVLLARVPNVLKSDIYATAALAGAAVMLLGQRAGMTVFRSAVLGALACFALRLIAVSQGWRLPSV
ncbi:MAG: TRIC cation channel family protein [Sphingomonadaceae bacterium]|nr:TRIC cation channel family protein [Sphingomonadaceae bacterium]